ncbi:MAG: aldehyde:ferredoxin oxidoreductase [Desulfobacteraceae bacterium]|nr:MAG: aldehyde:ferredoxin oxidoreductase [Desulfobacteraceae bacterium]
MLNRKVAFIDLFTSSWESEPVPEELRRSYLGGRGINMHLLSRSFSPRSDPFSPENPLIFGAGMLAGSLSFGSRINISARSPESGYLGDSSMGGDFGAEMAYAGFSHLVIQGRSEKPVYIFIRDGRIDFRDARHLRGLDTLQTQKQIRLELGDDRVQIACIGQAGENRVRFASVRTGMKSAAGRTGMGAVMGSKNLKAVAFRGTQELQVADPQGLLEYYGEAQRRLVETKWARALGRQGTPLLFQFANAMGFLSYRNHQYTTVGEKGRALEAEALEKYSTGMLSCFGCPVHCRHRISLADGPYAGLVGEGPEYASIGSLGPKIGNLDLETIIHATELCNLYGLDTISTGSYIAWAMELFQRGIIDQKITGIPLEWGDSKTVPEIVRRIAHREGIGDLLAEGYRAADEFGPSSLDYLPSVKRFPLEMTDERLPKSFALGMATSTRGACHMRSRPSIDVLGLPEEVLRRIYGGPVGNQLSSYAGKARMVWWHELHNAVSDSLGFCRFLTVFSSPHAPRYEDFSTWIRLTAGLSPSPEELLLAGERIYTLERGMLVGDDLSRKDDTLPRIYFEPVVEGPAEGSVIDAQEFQEMLDEYYRLHGWNRQGIPTKKTLERLGIG